MSMSGEAERGTRFARDLRLIRRARGVSLTDIHYATRMAHDLIKGFEHNALIGHPRFNRVYLRLFARAYAEHLGLDAEMTLEALDLAIQGRYAGSLAKEYLGESGEKTEEEPPEKGKEKKKAPAARPPVARKAASREKTSDRGASAKSSAKPSSGASSGIAAVKPSGSASAGEPAESADGKLDPRWIFVGVLVAAIGLGVWALLTLTG